MNSVELLLSYLRSPPAQYAVLLPVGLGTCFGLQPLRVEHGRAWLWTTAATAYTARWEFSEHATQLFLMPWFFIYLAVSLYWRHSWSPGQAYLLMFLSLMSADLTLALSRARDEGLPLSQFYQGVGGAGLQDALFAIPLCAALLVVYVQFRIAPRKKSFFS